LVCPLIVVRQGEKYHSGYVERLRKQAWDTSRMETIVLGDGHDADIKLERGYEGWWSKIELLRPDIPKPFVYIDLDSFILRDISYLSDLSGNWISREWWKGMTGVQSSVMKIEHSSEMWEEWLSVESTLLGHRNGDQEFFKRFEWNYFQDFLPRAVGSYKVHNREKPVNDIVTFHGKPLMKDAGGWAEELWKNQQLT